MDSTIFRSVSPSDLGNLSDSQLTTLREYSQNVISFDWDFEIATNAAATATKLSGPEAGGLNIVAAVAETMSANFQSKAVVR